MIQMHLLLDVQEIMIQIHLLLDVVQKAMSQILLLPEEV
jgi:hypothetical protein